MSGAGNHLAFSGTGFVFRTITWEPAVVGPGPTVMTRGSC